MDLGRLELITDGETEQEKSNTGILGPRADRKPGKEVKNRPLTDVRRRIKHQTEKKIIGALGKTSELIVMKSISFHARQDLCSLSKTSATSKISPEDP